MIYASLVTLATGKTQLGFYVEDGEQAYEQSLEAQKGLTALLPSRPICAQTYEIPIGRVDLQKVERWSSIQGFL